MKANPSRIRVGDRVTYKGKHVAGYHEHGGTNWLRPGAPGVVVEIHEGSPELTLRGNYFPGIRAWAVVEYQGDLGPTRRAMDL
jgi:hypothetical protein